jgi:signal transduction histidine kinase
VNSRPADPADPATPANPATPATPATPANPATPAAQPTHARPPLVRSAEGRGLGGVARGVAKHLGVSVALVRWAFVGTSVLFGAGALFYVFLWAMVPREGADGRGPLPILLRLRWTRRTAMVVAGAALLAIGMLLAAQAAGANVHWEWWLPTGALLAGVGLAWSQLEHRGGPGRAAGGDAVPKADIAGPPRPAAGQAWAGRSPVSWARLAGGVVLVIAGVVLLIGQNRPVASLGYAIVAGVAVVAGVGTVLAPWWARLLRELGDERAARAREAERADIAAHLHDSVLQTLAVLRAQSEDPDAVRRLARAQERELRRWLYETRAPASDSVAAGLKDVVAEVEDASGVEIGIVVVGDAPPWPAAEALLRALREALTNATRHGAPPIDVYLEVSERGIEAYVRDRGAGFDLAAVSSDRLGVRESIIGRMQRSGGSARVSRALGGGTEVRLAVPASAGGGAR